MKDQVIQKIGVGILTCNRPKFLAECLKSVKDCNIERLVIVNDGEYIDPLWLDQVYNDNEESNTPYSLIQNESRVCKEQKYHSKVAA